MRQIIAILFSLLLTAGAFAQDCTSHWELFDSSPLIEIALPDTHVTYWRYRFQVEDGKPFVLRLKANFPHGRYMNYNVYDQETLDTTGAMTDFKMVADEGAINPFLPGNSRTSPARSYTAWVIPQGSSRPSTPNILEMPVPIPEGEPKAIELWYRIYAPDQGQIPNGGEALPTIEAFTDIDAKTPAECPTTRRLSAPLWRALGNLPPKDNGGAIRSYHGKPATMYANFDTDYLLSALNFRQGAFAVLRFKAPTFPKTFTSAEPVSGRDDMRYWSICLGGASTRTSDCLVDYQAKIAEDGWVNLVMAPKEFEARVRALGFNYLPTPTFVVPLLLYRNLLPIPGYPGDFAKAPRWNAESKTQPDAAHRLEAIHFIGDYAPRGQHCGEEDFFANYCGVKVSFPKEEKK